jgi:hypothetical protein
MAFPTGTCACGATFAKINKLRALCPVCQIIRDTTYRPHMKKDCGTCGKEFYPVRTNYTTCDECTPIPMDPDKYPDCNVCGFPVRPAAGLASTCVLCIQKDPALRDKYVRTLAALKRARIKALRAGEPVPETWSDVINNQEELT